MNPAITIKQLRVFSQIAQQGSLSQAAIELHLSKAAVSLALGELEKQLGYSLFDRVNKRLQLNQQGRLLLPLSDELLQRHHQLASLSNQPSALTGQLKIGASQTIGNHLLPAMLAAFNPNHQGPGLVDKDIRISNNDLLCQQLLDFQIDVGLTEGEVSDPQLIAQRFGGDEMCVIAPKDCPLASASSLDISELEQQQWLLRESGSGSRNYFLKHVAPALNSWQEGYQFNATTAIINGVAAGLGLSCLSLHSLHASRVADQVVRLPLKQALFRDYYLVLHKDKYRGALLTHFTEFVLAS